MKTIKKLGLVSAVAFAMLALSACDDSSSASSDETGSSSSSVESSDLDESSSSVDKKSSGNESTEKDKSSSSVKGSEPVEVSSSSAKETKDSADSKSSSSVKSGESSSSSKDKSSSSVSSSSSEKQSSSSVGSSSSSEKQSSSSVASSSSEYVPFDHSKAFDGTLWRKGAYKTFVDERNNREYYYLQIDGKKCLEYSETDRCLSTKDTSISVMAENLNVGEMVRGFKDQKDDSKIERYCYDNDTTNCDRYGGLYQWAEMMGFNDSCNTKSCAHLIQENHQGICPNGWRLLTYDDFYIIVNSNGNTHGVEGVRSTFGFGGFNTTGFSLVGAGLRKDNGQFSQLNDITLWYYPAELVDNGNVYPKSGSTTYSGTAFYPENHGNYTKLAGFSVRCVIVNQK
ncbi:FISUMP domain-containing protein [Hallerella succinigenes]|uniref:Uncharacterized protein (TIGR02145 family) n=1 Tax=Hallerella succinigenes TaxID=1896222 RepID=A0A2M9A508_9BACT|nr:FISUMP domain-containing protein [Hallerella succinigenes]PJJ40801.1 uncharacterized protein (TIGR02145 family) [Hallerella succinigenes]